MKRGLGRGLDSLFGGLDNEDILNSINSEIKNEENKVVPEEIKEITGEPKEIEIGLIDRNPGQPRKNFDETALEELATSIKSHGVIQPIIVKKVGDRYVIIAGERRYRASRIAGIKTIIPIRKSVKFPSSRTCKGKI